MNRKNLTIVFVTNNYKPYCGGVAKSIEVYRDALQKLDHTVHIITLDFLGKQSQQEENVFNIFCPLRFLYKKNCMAVPWFPHKAVKKLIAELKPDIIHAHHPFLLGQSALKASKKYNIPLVYTYHTMYEEYTHYIPLPQFWIKRYVTKIVCAYCQEVDGIIVPSKVIKDSLKHAMIETKSMVIPSPIKPYFYDPSIHFSLREKHSGCTQSSSFGPSMLAVNSTSVKSKAINPCVHPECTPEQQAKAGVSKDPHTFKLITVSRFVKEKNIPFLLEVFSKLDQKKFSFTLVGYGAEQHNLENYAYNTLKLSPEAVTFVHKPEPEVLRNYYDESDLFIFASTSDTQGLVLAESMARGTPVVALNGPGQQDIIVSGVNGFLVNSCQEMVNVINRIANNSELHNMMCKQALQTASNYSPEKLAQRLAEFYCEVLAKK